MQLDGTGRSMATERPETEHDDVVESNEWISLLLLPVELLLVEFILHTARSTP